MGVPLWKSIVMTPTALFAVCNRDEIRACVSCASRYLLPFFFLNTLVNLFCHQGWKAKRTDVISIMLQRFDLHPVENVKRRRCPLYCKKTLVDVYSFWKRHGIDWDEKNDPSSYTNLNILIYNLIHVSGNNLLWGERIMIKSIIQ